MAYLVAVNCAVMLAALIGCALATQTALPAQLQGVHRIVTMGDSITEGGAQPKGYVTLMSKALKSAYPDNPIEIVNVGIGGQKAPDMAARFQRDVIDKKPDLVTISVGVNDVWHDFRTPEWNGRVPEGNSGRGVALPVFVSNVDAMIKAAQAAKIRVVLLAPTLVYEDLDCPENKRLSKYVSAGEKLAKERGVPYVNLNRAFRDTVSTYQKIGGKGSLLLTTDGVHMNDAGNALMAGVILKALGVPVADEVAAK